MLKIRFFTILGIIIFSCSIFVDTANSSMAQNAARAVIKAKKCYDATPSSYKKSMLTSMSRAVTHWNDGNKFSKMNQAQMANFNFQTANTYANQVLSIGRAYRIPACN